MEFKDKPSYEEGRQLIEGTSYEYSNSFIMNHEHRLNR